MIIVIESKKLPIHHDIKDIEYVALAMRQLSSYGFGGGASTATKARLRLAAALRPLQRPRRLDFMN